ncbi:C-terminal processing protease CtpA/Prc, contains a PDZ domain [Maribacter orientalis]|uniref:C-terminal processing protease CtpA/Prc, contains a PDZ domain n=1 Tax=Maribacter orientalis TaxID=228957 RepID=A0A1H7H1G3_9FLAO|nr:S41 family peptidase [Maribacter orientalis]SEK43132.1 C-terminal processing protease CtpA/Prc, contains a PDZ domain [Maribacter orientalis]
MKKILVLLFITVIFSCSKDEDLILTKTIDPDGSADVEVQDFMWKAMNFWYFWQANVDDLGDDRFVNTKEGRAEYTAFLDSEDNPAAFFENKLQYIEDRFSFYNEDYRELTNSLAGISKSNGLEFGLVRFQDSEELFGVVRYIIPNSNAATANILRGDLFTGVDGQTLTLSNYEELLFTGSDTYTLNMADFVNGTIVPNEEEVTLTKAQALAENPVLISKSFEIGGENIGYIMYNQFTNEYDDDLYAAIEALKSAGITNLVMDLRYNPGGSVNTTRLLASMIYGTNTSDVFLRKRYNDKLQNQFNDSQLEVYFADKVNGKTINSLGFTKLYVLTSSSSASASELLINSLEPYIDVIQIGDVTRGKNEFSTTLVDDRDNSYLYTPSRVNKINPNNQWAIQPLIGRNENADGFFDFTSGLQPDIILKEDYGNLGILGEQNEPLLARAIEAITGQTGKRDFTVLNPMEVFISSKVRNPIYDKMIDDTVYNLEF